MVGWNYGGKTTVFFFFFCSNLSPKLTEKIAMSRERNVAPRRHVTVRRSCARGGVNNIPRPLWNDNALRHALVDCHTNTRTWSDMSITSFQLLFNCRPETDKYFNIRATSYDVPFTMPPPLRACRRGGGRVVIIITTQCGIRESETGRELARLRSRFKSE